MLGDTGAASFAGNSTYNSNNGSNAYCPTMPIGVDTRVCDSLKNNRVRD